MGLYSSQKIFHQEGYQMIAGVDEVGRGCLAGPVCAAAVILPIDLRIPNLNDSKKLLPEVRQKVSVAVLAKAIAYNIVMVSVEEIDRLNILWASMKAMKLAVEGLGRQPDLLLVDGNREADLPIPQRAIVEGDGRCASIAAASVIAKVHRDRYMTEQQERYPSFTFGSHKGYATPQHLRELDLHGPTPLHRRSFSPVFQAELFD